MKINKFVDYQGAIYFFACAVSAGCFPNQKYLVFLFPSPGISDAIEMARRHNRTILIERLLDCYVTHSVLAFVLATVVY